MRERIQASVKITHFFNEEQTTKAKDNLSTNHMMIVAAVVFLTAAIVATTTSTTAQPYTDCDVSTYYSSLLDITSRDDMHNLLKSTHRNQLPYSSSSYGDTWDALISLDSDDDANTNVKLIYKDVWVPSIPYD